jgi:F0F1-type ATP synthase assembly protein I
MPDEPKDSQSPHDEPSEEELERRLRKLIGDDPDSDTALLPPSMQPPAELDELELKLQEIDQRIADAGQVGRAKAAGFDADLETDLQRVESKAAEAKAAQEAARQDREKKGISDGDSARGLGVGLSIAYTIIGVPLLGVLIGWIADSSMGTTNWKGIGMLVGVVVGMALAFVLLNRTKDLR